jgi:hypothetical protein
MTRKTILETHLDDPNDGNDANMAKCYETAVKNGHYVLEAADCQNGSVGCPDCPFKEETKK